MKYLKKFNESNDVLYTDITDSSEYIPYQNYLEFGKNEIEQMVQSNFPTNFPKVLIQIEERIDIIYDLITKLDNNN